MHDRLDGFTMTRTLPNSTKPRDFRALAAPRTTALTLRTIRPAGNVSDRPSLMVQTTPNARRSCHLDDAARVRCTGASGADRRVRLAKSFPAAEDVPSKPKHAEIATMTRHFVAAIPSDPGLSRLDNSLVFSHSPLNIHGCGRRRESGGSGTGGRGRPNAAGAISFAEARASSSPKPKIVS